MRNVPVQSVVGTADQTDTRWVVDELYATLAREVNVGYPEVALSIEDIVSAAEPFALFTDRRYSTPARSLTLAVVNCVPSVVLEDARTFEI